MSAPAASCSSCQRLLEPWTSWWAQQRDGAEIQSVKPENPTLVACPEHAPHCPRELQSPFPSLSPLRECREDAPVVSILPILWKHICWPHFASRLSGVAGDSSLTFTQVGCTSIQSPGMQSMLHFPPWRCFWFLSSCLSLFSPSSVIQLILSLTGFHFLYKYIAFSLASWLWKGFNTLLSPHLLFFVTIKGYSFFSRSLE